MRRTLFFQRPLPYTYYNATIILVVINVAIFLIRYLAPGFDENIIWKYMPLVPDQVLRLEQVWTVFTYMFVHGDPFHIIFNMLALLIFGIAMEHKMGSHEFLLYYLLTGTLTGVLLTFVYDPMGWGHITVVGASAAIYALLLAYATYFPYSTLLIWGIIPIKAYILVLGLVAFSVIASLFNIMGNVSHLGHLGGVLFGFLYFLIRLRINPVKEIIYTRRYYK
ncbi:MAG TPA: rhomboid family intramembrane serine protease [Spirochaetia bacterium]|nr:rhomboid family intramembrane serine protease [Spirochaetia bacterium]